MGTSFLNAIAKKHPREPHWYLFLLVTDPEYQRRGIGSLLMNDALPRIDADGVIAYLETQKEDNLAYYRRFGFEVVTTLTPVRNGPPLYAMQRPSR
jgi:ribosomal protein S18 acetylase RimI-like enzyme